MTIAAYPKHHSFKPSGFDWVGDVPEHWGVEKLGSMLTAVSEKNRPDLPLLSITREQGVIERDVEDQDSNHNFIPDDLSGYKVLREGQFGMNKMKAWQGSYGVSAHTGIVSPAYFIFDFAREVDPHFFNIAIRSKLYVSYFGSASDGVRVGQWDLNQSRMRQIPVLLPPLSEQRAIAAFLDGKCATIDEAVRIKEEQIRLLAERRQILIQEAVTRGLTPDAPMKDSGIDWIGQIPAHWEVPCLKHVSKFVLDGTHGSFPRTEMGYRLLSVRNVINGKFCFREDDSRVSEAHFREISRKFLIQKNDIQLAIVGATLGKVALVEEMSEPFVTQRSLATIRANSKADPEYLAYYLEAPMYQSFLWSNAGYSAQPGIYLETIQGSSVPLPPVTEQQEIVEFLEKETSKIHAAVELKYSQITALREYKTSLINAAVTGKIKVL
ncbi:restriction endonuclease subunit S [Acetobacter orientalis]|uniref:restriction endonuclease subunit S n=1 Tax=Acetobacter orientalis TaxID=146474 RepID=UPI0039E7FB86